MKKLTAMLLALCMLLAAVPALGEDFSGTWYMVLEDVTLGTFDLNADGTAKMVMKAGEENTLEYEGTWEAADDGVTITMEGDALGFVYDAETDTLNSERFPIPMGKTTGSMNLELIAKVMNGAEDIELPEGVSETEVKTKALLVYTKIMTLAAELSAQNSYTVETETKAAEDAPELTVVAESFKVVESYRGFRAVYIAKVQNNTEAPLWIDEGRMTVKDAEGNQVGEAKYMACNGSKYLEPGEISFVSMEADMDENLEGITFEKTITTEAKGYRTDKAVTVTDPTYVAAGNYDSGYMRATVVNDSEESIPGIYVIYALEDAEGNLLDLQRESLYRHELGANSTIILVTSIDSKVNDYCKANGIEPAVVEAYAYVEED